MMMKLVALAVALLVSGASAFQARPSLVQRAGHQQQQQHARTPTLLKEQVKDYLAERYPNLMNILGNNDAVWKKLSASEAGFTIFAPNEQAFQDLGEKKMLQLNDDRNKELAEKVGAYHAVEEPVSADELFASGGVVTLGGDVPVGRSMTGGFMGIGGKEDGGVTVNGAKVIGTTQVESCTIHEMDALISPQILWRYIDQLRIPGSN